MDYTGRRMRRPVLFCMLAASLAGCKSADGPTRTRVIIEQKQVETRGKPKKPVEWYGEQLKLAHEERDRGQVRQALERVQAARQENPPDPYYGDFRVMVQRLLGDVLELETITARVEADKDPIVFGEPLRLRIYLKNGTRRRVRIPARQEGQSPSLFVLDAARRDYDIRAHVTTRQRRIVRPLKQDFILEPGAEASRVIILAADKIGNNGPLDGFRSFTLGGQLRPAYIEIGGLRRWESIRIKGVTVRAFRAGYGHLADDPVKRIGQAIEKNAPIHLVTAAALCPRERRVEAVDKMVAALQGGRLIDWSMFAALQYLTGVELGRDAGAWRAWWPRVREGYFAPKGKETKKSKEPQFD